MRAELTLTLVVVALAGGCKPKVGDLKTVDVVGDAQGDPSHPADVHVALSAGELHVSPGGAHVVGGAVRSNVRDLDPVVDAAGAHVTVTQGKPGDDTNASKYGSDLVADWRLTLGTTPMALALTAGAASADVELGGVALKSFTMKTGSGAVRVGWNAPNTINADNLDIETGAGSVVLNDLGRFGASKVRVHSGVGTVTVSLGSKVDRDVVLDLEAGAGALIVKVPPAVTARADVKQGAGSVKIDGWTKDGDAYVLGAPGAPPRVNVTAKTGAGSITLVASP